MSAKTYTQLINDLLADIKANNNFEITANTLQARIKDIIDTIFTQIKLESGVLANYIYNTGTYTGDRAQTLLTWTAISNLIGGAGGNSAIISGGTVISWNDENLDDISNGGFIDDIPLATGDYILLGGQIDTSENGWWEVGEIASETSRPTGFDTSVQGSTLAIIDLYDEITGPAFIINVDESGFVTVNPLNSDIRSFPNITGLTGGTNTDLDSLSTLYSPVGIRINIGNDTNSIYELKAGTELENAPLIIRPDDFVEADSGSGSASDSVIINDNEKYWELVQVQSSSSYVSHEIIASGNETNDENGNFKFEISSGKLYIKERVAGTWKNIASWKK